MTQVASPAESTRIVGNWAEEGAAWFQAYTRISREVLAYAIYGAHDRGLKVTGHICSVSFS